MSRILDSLARHASERGEEIAVVTDSLMISWQGLLERVAERSLWLSGQGVQTLGFQLDNGIEWIVTDLACLDAGITSVPIPVFFTHAQVEHVLQDAGVELLISGDADGVDVPVQGDVRARPTGIAPRANECAKVTYTSGSTGQPKGVRLSAETMDEVTLGIVEAMASIDLNHHLCVLPLATLLENIAGLYAPIIRGIKVTAISSESIGLTSNQLDVNRFADTLNRVCPDSVILVPQLLTALVTLAELGMIEWPNAKMIAVGGGKVSLHALEKARALSLPVYQGYGLSECCSVVTLCVPGANREGSVGRALPHARLRVSAEGEIEVAGARMVGYLGETSAPDSEWYPTGDVGRIDDDGYVYIEGRKRNVFVTSFGRNVNPEWVESALTAHASIAQALAWGEAQDHNIALLWPRFPVSDEQLDEIIRIANRELPEYARISDVIVIDEPLPPDAVTDNGRLRREKVLAEYQHLIDQHYQQTQTRGQNIAVL